MDEWLKLSRDVQIPLSEISVRVSRSSGPGGQHANVTASRVEASLDLAASRALDEAQKERIRARLGSRPRAVAQDTRSQSRNRQLALERLRARLAAALQVRRARRATRPSAAARERRLQRKRRAGERKRLRRPPPLEDP